jgi:hypothetical protein
MIWSNFSGFNQTTGINSINNQITHDSDLRWSIKPLLILMTKIYNKIRLNLSPKVNLDTRLNELILRVYYFSYSVKKFTFLEWCHKIKPKPVLFHIERVYPHKK